MTEIALRPVGKPVEGRICGELLAYGRLVSPLGDIDIATGLLKSAGTIGNKIVAVKGFTGSTVGPYVVYALKKKGLAPKALVVEQLDVNVVASATISDIPLFKADGLSDIERLYREGLRFVCIENGRLRPKGVVIAVEGIDGSGKTTISRRLLDIFGKCGFRAAYTYEPYYDAIRTIFEMGTMELTPESEALLMIADRYSHYSKVVKEEVERGGIVILDRYKYSTIAYQGAVGLPTDWLREVQRYLPDPDVAIYLDVDPEEGLKRKMKGGSRSLTYFEDLERVRRAREIYLDMVSRGELALIDASPELSRVVEDVIKAIEKELGLELGKCLS